MNLLRPFYNLRIAYKLFLSYSAVFVLAVILGSMVIYSRVRNTIEFNIESELKNSTETILNMVQTSVAVSIKNHLRAMAEKNREIVEYFNGLYRQGLVTEEEAKSRAGAVLLNQTIGETGYIFVWDIRNAPQSIPLSVHPKIQGKDVAYVDFVQTGAKLKNGYMEYEWKNPGEDKARAKSMYLSYFEPWQWVVAASSYREEFNKLVNVDDFRDSIMSLRFGKTGYPYVIDTKGNIIIHPHLKGNLYDLMDAQGRLFIKEICTQKNGKIIYPWKDPEQKAFREKLVIFNYIPEYDWIVASSCNLDEIYAPLQTVRNIIIVLVLAALLLGILISFRISSSITKPLQNLTKRFSSGAKGDLSVRMESQSMDEVGQLAHYFNDFMDRLEGYSKNLESEISERKQAEQALRESEEKYRTILDNIEDGYFEVDINGNFNFFNNSVCRITGYSKTELIGMNHRQYTDKENAEKVLEVFNRVYTTGEPARAFDWEFIRKDGTKRHVDASVSLIRNAEGLPIGFRGIARDVTKRKRAEEALRESEKRYRTVLEANPDPVIVYDMNGKVLYFNPAFTILFGWTLEEHLGKKMDLFVPEENLPETLEMIEKVKCGDSFTNLETRRYTLDGETIDISMSAAIWHDRAGVPEGSVITLRDITEQKKLQAQLQHAQKMESIGTIASGVAHNFRNVLAGISVNNQLIQMKYPDKKKLIDITDRINNSVKRGSQLVSELTQFSRKQSTKNFRIMNLAEVIKDTYDLVSKSFDKLIDIRIDLPDSLPVMGDSSSLSQVMMNLCTNARDAMPEGGVLSIKARQKGKQAEIIISDTGHGMDKETLKKCFDPFYSTKEVDKGTGLGLSTSYGIVREHDGDIHAYSELNKGTTFKLYFPMSIADEDRKHKDGPEILRGKGEKILIVDDEIEVLGPMEEMLEGLGYRAKSSSSGKEAIERFASWRPHAVCLDRNMPGMDGITCAGKIIELDPAAKIILISGYDKQGPNGIDYKTGDYVKGYLTKPIDIVQLSRILGRLFDNDA